MSGPGADDISAFAGRSKGTGDEAAAYFCLPNACHMSSLLKHGSLAPILAVTGRSALHRGGSRCRTAAGTCHRKSGTLVGSMSKKIITLLTDFGCLDGYVASMKGVILGICPDVQIVDISHSIPPQDIRSGSFVLASASGDFPRGTVHLAVVDPGVGTDRRAIAVATPQCFFVGPDNGIFSLALRRESALEARSLDNPRFLRPRISNTFHGRDIFAPVAAHLAAGAEFHLLGPICRPFMASWNEPVCDSTGVHGEVIHIDRFGNAVTNLERSLLSGLAFPGEWTVRVRDALSCRPVSTYGDGNPGDLVALIGSSDFLEIAVNRGNASISYGIRIGDPVSATRPPAHSLSPGSPT